jgi:hypothetical protein
MQGADRNTSFCEVVCKTIGARWVLTKRIVFPLRAAIWAVINFYHLGA